MDPDPYVSQSQPINKKSELVDLLFAWLERSDAETIGEVGTYGGRPWLRFTINGYRVVLNADTTRPAVETYVHDNRANPDQPWRVIANRNDVFNKIVPGPYHEPLPGWYGYLVVPLDGTNRI